MSNGQHQPRSPRRQPDQGSRAAAHAERHGGASGQAVDIEIQAKEIVRMRELLDEILAFHTGQALDRVSKDTDRDFIMSGIEAKEYGIVDEILTNRELAAVPSAEGTS
jgi:ATP-dependent Clp protease protease subunit